MVSNDESYHEQQQQTVVDDGLAVLDWVKKELGGSASQVGLQLSTFGEISDKSRTFQTSLVHFRQVLDISDKSQTFQTNSFLTLRITPDTHEYRNVICSKHKQTPSYNQLKLGFS